MAGFRQGGLSLKKRDNGSASDINFVSFYVDSFDRLYSVDTFGISALVSNQWSTGCIDEDIPELIKTTDNITVPELRVAIFSTPNFRGPLFRKTVSQASFTVPRDGHSKYVVVDYDSGTPYFRIETNIHNVNQSNVVCLYTVWNLNGNIHSILFDNKGEGLANKIDCAIQRTTPYRRSIEGGLILSVDASRYIHVSDSHVYAGTTEVQISSFDSITDRVTEFYHTTGSWTFPETITGYQVDNLHFDNGTDLSVASNNKYLCRWVYRTIGDDKEVFVRIGTGEYNSVADAQKELEPVSPSIVKEHGMLIGRIIIQKGSSTTLVNSIFEFAGGSGSASVSNHNDLSNIQGGDSVNSEYYHLDYERAVYISAVSADVQTQINDLKMLTSVTGITQVYADSHYLKLDGSNGPITSNLSVLGTLSASSVSATNLTATNIQGTSITVGNVSDTEFQRLDGVSANIQTQFSTLSATKADKSVIISGTNGISGGGDLTQDRTLSLSTVGTSGTFTKVTTDQYGRTISGTSLLASDIPSVIDASKIADGSVTSTEFQYINTLTANAQNQLTALSASRLFAANGADNRIATFTNTNTLNGEANLTFDGYDLTLSAVGAGARLNLDTTSNDGGSGIRLRLSGTNQWFFGTISSNFSVLDYSTSNYDISITSGANGLITLGSGTKKVNLPSLSTSAVVVTDGSKNLVSSNITTTELGYLDNATSNIQDQLNSKATTASLSAYQTRSEKGVANGYASLDSNGKVPTSQLPEEILGNMVYKGTWNATTNSPSITTASSANKGWYYIVTVSGTSIPSGLNPTTSASIMAGTNKWNIGDWIVSDGTYWDKIDNTDQVMSVFGRMGAVVAQAGDYNATQITNTAAGTITATNVQNALNELDTEKVTKATTITAGTGLTGGGDLTTNRTISLATTGTSGTYTNIITNAYGQVTSARNLIASDLPSGIDASKISTGVVSNTEFNFLDGTSANLQNQLSNLSATKANNVIVSGTSGLIGGGDLLQNRYIGMPNVGTAGTYTKTTTDQYGRVTAGGSLTSGDIPTLPATKIGTGVVSNTEFNQLDGVSANIQNQLNSISNNKYTTTISVLATIGQVFTITHNLGYLRPLLKLVDETNHQEILVSPNYISTTQLSFGINSRTSRTVQVMVQI